MFRLLFINAKPVSIILYIYFFWSLQPLSSFHALCWRGTEQVSHFVIRPTGRPENKQASHLIHYFICYGLRILPTAFGCLRMLVFQYRSVHSVVDYMSTVNSRCTGSSSTGSKYFFGTANKLFFNYERALMPEFVRLAHSLLSLNNYYQKVIKIFWNNKINHLLRLKGKLLL